MATGTIKKNPVVLNKAYSATYSIGAGGSATVSLSDLKDEDNVAFTQISGYTQCGVLQIASGSADVVIRGYNVYNTNGGIYFVNLSNSALSNKTCNVRILWLRT